MEVYGGRPGVPPNVGQKVVKPQNQRRQAPVERKPTPERHQPEIRSPSGECLHPQTAPLIGAV